MADKGKCKTSLTDFSKAVNGGTAKAVLGTKDNKKIMGDCGIVPKYMTQNDADIAHSKIMGKVGGKAKGGLTYDQYLEEYAVEIGAAIAKKEKGADGKAKFLELIANGKPKTHGATQAQKGGATGRLTDTTKYTGSHKERFDDSGKGKGITGREDRAMNDGYVGNYKGDGTYDEKH